MIAIVHLTPDFAVAGQLQPEDFAELATLGFRAVINNRPDGEEECQLGDRLAAVHAWRAGLQYRSIPAGKLDLFTDPVVAATVQALAELEGPVLAYCKSGLRSTIVWAAASARSRPVDAVLADLAGAGQELEFLRDELDAQADRERWMTADPVAGAIDEEQSRAAA